MLELPNNGSGDEPSGTTCTCGHEEDEHEDSGFFRPCTVEGVGEELIEDIIAGTYTREVGCDCRDFNLA